MANPPTRPIAKLRSVDEEVPTEPGPSTWSETILEHVRNDDPRARRRYRQQIRQSIVIWPGRVGRLAAFLLTAHHCEPDETDQQKKAIRP